MKQELMLTPFGQWRTRAEYLGDLISLISRQILPCTEHCERECVFKDVGKGAGCPLLEFEDRVLEALGEEQ